MNQRVERLVVGDGVEVAYAVSGSGPFLLAPPPWVSHVELDWAIPHHRRFWEALAEHRTVVRFDRPGTGMSSGRLVEPSLDAELDLVAAVAAATGADRHELLGVSLAGPLCVAWAARHPTRVERIVLHGGWARGADLVAPAARDHILGLVGAHWGLGSEVLADIFVPDADGALRAALVQYQRESADAEVAAAVLRFGYTLDVVDLLGRVTAPTLVLHRRHDRAVPRQQAELLAQGIAGARAVMLPGRSHVVYAGDQDAVLAEIRRFCGMPAPRTRSRPTLTPRQTEVARLVAEGLSNRVIAQRLGIDERSVEGHLDRIRDRLDLRSRAALAAWWVGTHGG